jgi:hypothetical protein
MERRAVEQLAKADRLLRSSDQAKEIEQETSNTTGESDSPTNPIP